MNLVSFPALFLMLTLLPLRALAATPQRCPELAAWFQAKEELARTKEMVEQERRAGMAPDGESLNSLDVASLSVNSAARQVTKSLFSEYLQGKFDNRRIESCIGEQADRQNFLDTLQATFLDATIDRLRSARTPAISAFIHLLDKDRRNGRVILFKMTGYFNEPAPASMKAGIQRREGSIYIDFARIDPDEWMVLITHELLHRLDDQIAPAVDQFAHLQKRIFESEKILDQWVLAGLNRGLLFEYRAWRATFAIYREATRQSLWRPVGWMEEAIRQIDRRGEGAFSSRLYSFLDERFTNPDEGIFANEKVAAAVLELRKKIREGRLPPMGSLGPIVRKD